MKHILIPIFFALTFCRTSTKADDGGYWGTVLQIGAANYVVQMDDGSLLDVEWDSGYDDWARGDRVILTTEAVAAICTAKADKPRSMSFPIIPQILAASPKNKRMLNERDDLRVLPGKIPPECGVAFD